MWACCPQARRMNKPNFDKQMQAVLQTVPRGTPLLLHSCCAPCSSRCIEELKEHFSVTVLYYNPNICPQEEYEKRKGEQLRFLRETGWAAFLDCDYAPQEFADAVQGLEGEPEGGLRCRACFALRLGVLARTARGHGFPWVCSTLSVSPHKNAAWLNEIGQAQAERYGVQWLPNDFKKRSGYLRSIRLSAEHALYRQTYCGCEFSLHADPAQRRSG